MPQASGQRPSGSSSAPARSHSWLLSLSCHVRYMERAPSFGRISRADKQLQSAQGEGPVRIFSNSLRMRSIAIQLKVSLSERIPLKYAQRWRTRIRKRNGCANHAQGVFAETEACIAHALNHLPVNIRPSAKRIHPGAINPSGHCVHRKITSSQILRYFFDKATSVG